MCNEKVGLRPLVCFAKSRYTAVLSLLIYARAGGKDKPRQWGFHGAGRSGDVAPASTV